VPKVWHELSIDREKIQAADKPTLYKQIRSTSSAEFSRRVAPGHRIPFEHELMARYRCSRMTVSRRCRNWRRPI